MTMLPSMPTGRRCWNLCRRRGCGRYCPPPSTRNPPAGRWRCAADPACRAIGEIGLDYHYEDGAPRQVQREWFRRQLALAQERNLPVVIHDRDAHEDTLRILEEYKPRGVVHCFSGSVEMMRRLTAWGLYIGIGGVVTFKNARRAVEVAAAVPADRLLLETDAPYMAPEPERGQRNHSGRIVHVARRLAEIRGEDPESLCRQTCANACRLFGVHLPAAE